MKVAFQSLQDRGIEWFSGCVMVAWGITFAMPGDLFQTQASFKAFAQYASEDVFAVVFGGVGAARMVALFINGRWPRSPIVRIFGAAFGAIIWGRVAVLFYESAAMNGALIGTGPAVYALLAVFEIFAINRAAFDARYHTP